MTASSKRLQGPASLASVSPQPQQCLALIFNPKVFAPNGCFALVLFFLDVVVLVLDVLSQGSALFEELLSLAFSR